MSRFSAVTMLINEVHARDYVISINRSINLIIDYFNNRLIVAALHLILTVRKLLQMMNKKSQT